MKDGMALLLAVVLGVVLVAAFVVLLIPEPSERAVVATERLDVAVLAFRNSSSWRGAEETLRGRVEYGLVNEEGISVFSRAQLDALLMERALGAAGVIDPATAIEIGTLTGVSKIVTGTVYAVDTQSEDTTMCLAWENGACVEEVPAQKYTARMLAQVEVIDARSGKIENAVDTGGSGSTTVRQGTTFGGFDSLLAEAATEIAGQVADRMTASYTRELRYGLYEGARSKREGYIGEGETRRFTTSDEVHLIVHFTRTRDGDLFDLSWVAPAGTAVATVADVVDSGDWRLYTLPLAGLAPGRYTVEAKISGSSAFETPFTISP
ncbi:MAG: CsgG/HfaB family protein [Candidatus Bipolaricaulota bacterium]